MPCLRPAKMLPKCPYGFLEPANPAQLEAKPDGERCTAEREENLRHNRCRATRNLSNKQTGWQKEWYQLSDTFFSTATF